MPRWWKLLTKQQRPNQYSFQQSFGLHTNSGGLATWAVLTQDEKNVCDSAALGTGGTAYNNKQTLDMCVDSPFTLLHMSAGGAFTNQAGGALPGNRAKIYVSNRRYKWTIVNNELHPITVKFFWTTPRHDIRKERVNYTGGSLVDTYQGYDINDVMARCFDRDGAIAYGANCLNGVIDSFRPTQSNSWCSLFKIKKVVTMELHAGECRSLVFKRDKPWFMSDFLEANVNDFLAWKNKTMIPFIQIIGCPVHDTVEPRLVRLGQAYVSITFEMRAQTWCFTTKTSSYTQVAFDAPVPVAFTATTYASRPVAANVNEN